MATSQIDVANTIARGLRGCIRASTDLGCGFSARSEVVGKLVQCAETFERRDLDPLIASHQQNEPRPAGAAAVRRPLDVEGDEVLVGEVTVHDAPIRRRSREDDPVVV